MVLEKDKGNPGMRFILGLFVIALSIYLFYITLARSNSPELFLMPTSLHAPSYPCKTVEGPGFYVCIPSKLDYNITGDTLYFFSIDPNIRGSIKIFPELPDEKQWKDTLKNPLIKIFLGDIESLNNFDLMVRLLSHKWNPTLMGPKARLIPSWMKRRKDAQILIPEGSKSIIFYTPIRCLGFSFINSKVATISISQEDDTLHKEVIAGILVSIKLR